MSKDFKSLSIIGRRWFQKTYGNTYHSVKVSINGGDAVFKCNFAYGYGDTFEQTALELLHENGYTDRLYTSVFELEREGVQVDSDVRDVERRRDLAFL